jgi:hypothetical protein
LNKIRRIYTHFRNRPEAGSFVTSRSRPKFDSTRHHVWRPDLRSDTAIVLQGPIQRNDFFTVETVRRYRINFPNAPIIVSTWENEVGEHTDLIADLGGTVIVQPQPSLAGVHNANLQMASAASGVAEAARLGMTHVIKSRTDQRAYSERLIAVLHAGLASFPIGSRGGTQSQRVIALSQNTFAYRMYGVSDMFTFGAIEDLIRYWDGSIDHRPMKELVHTNSHRDFANLRVCEVHYCSEFLARTGWLLRWTLEDSWMALADRFIVLDASTVDLFWPKYSTTEERWRSYEGDPRFQEVDFAWWLLLFQGMISGEESILDLTW